jgi:hypothetical protein
MTREQRIKERREANIAYLNKNKEWKVNPIRDFILSILAFLIIISILTFPWWFFGWSLK